MMDADQTVPDESDHPVGVAPNQMVEIETEAGKRNHECLVIGAKILVPYKN